VPPFFLLTRGWKPPQLGPPASGLYQGRAGLGREARHHTAQHTRVAPSGLAVGTPATTPSSRADAIRATSESTAVKTLYINRCEAGHFSGVRMFAGQAPRKGSAGCSWRPKREPDQARRFAPRGMDAPGG
jgi:hypothetical protein